MIIVQHFDIVFKCSSIVHEYVQNFITHNQAKFQGLDLRIFSAYVLRPGSQDHENHRFKS